MQHGYVPRKLKNECSYLLSISLWYSHRESEVTYAVPSKLTDNKEREEKGIKYIYCPTHQYSQEMTMYLPKISSKKLHQTQKIVLKRSSEKEVQRFREVIKGMKNAQKGWNNFT